MWLSIFLCGHMNDKEFYLSSLACQHRCQKSKFAMTLLECVCLHPILSLCFCDCCPVSTGAFCQLQSLGNVLFCCFGLDAGTMILRICVWALPCNVENPLGPEIFWMVGGKCTALISAQDDATWTQSVLSLNARHMYELRHYSSSHCKHTLRD